MSLCNRIRVAILATVLGLSWLGFTPAGAQAQSPAEFYKGKTIRFIVGSGAGGGFSTYALLLGPHLGRFIPGEPTVTVEHMPGAGGINSLNYISNAAPRDGTVIAIAMPNFFVTPYTEPNATRFDPTKFKFLGRMSDFGRVLVAWHTSGLKTVDDLKAKPAFVGASSRRSTTSIAPELMNEMLGTKMKVITGFRGTGPTLVALEAGEVNATTVAVATLQSLHADWLRDKKINVIAGLDSNPVPYKGVPRVTDLIKDPKQKALWDFVALPAEFGTAVLVAPGVPDDRVKALRDAFMAAVNSPELKADAAKRKLDLNPMSGEALDALFAKNGSPTPEIVANVARVMGVTK